MPVGTVITEYFPPKTSAYNDPEDEKFAQIKEMIEGVDYIDEDEYEEPIVRDEDDEDEEERMARLQDHQERKKAMKMRGRKRLANMRTAEVDEESHESEEGKSEETSEEHSDDVESDESGEGVGLPKLKASRTRESLVNSDDSVFLRAVQQYDKKYAPTPKADDVRSEVQEELEVQMNPDGS